MERNRKQKKIKNKLLNEFSPHDFQIYFSSFISYTKNEEYENIHISKITFIIFDFSFLLSMVNQTKI